MERGGLPRVYNKNCFLITNALRAKYHIIIIDYILVGNKKYYSRNGEVIDKDKIFYLDIYLEEKIQENVDINLCIKDIFNNQYQYRLELNKLENRDVSMVRVIKEIN